jgi:hypothetical protein
VGVKDAKLSAKFEAFLKTVGKDSESDDERQKAPERALEEIKVANAQ